jgi:hypothetical protein
MTKGLPRALGRPPVGTEQFVRRLRVPINVSVTAAAAGAGVGFGTVVIGKLPEGNVLLFGAGGYFNFSSTSANLVATWGGNFGVGSAVTAAGALTTTEVNIIASSAIAAAVAKVSNGNKGLFTTGGGASSFTNTTPVMINNTAAGVSLNFNIAVNAADITDAQSAPITVTGYLDLVFMVLGDN